MVDIVLFVCIVYTFAIMMAPLMYVLRWSEGEENEWFLIKNFPRWLRRVIVLTFPISLPIWYLFLFVPVMFGYWLGMVFNKLFARWWN